jgi:ABC-type phosphate/phosphonate transport system substrate-binding protein
MPRNLILVRGDMDPKLQSEIKNVLMGMDKNEQGRKVMWNMLRTTKFDDLPEGIKDFLKNIRELYAFTEKSSN